MSQKSSVLFVCIGNAIRSQMAEAFARHYGADVLIPASAGLAPAVNIMPLTRKVMLDRNIDLGDAIPKGLHDLPQIPYDIVVNISGYPIPPELGRSHREWEIRDPMGGKEEKYQATASEIERRVVELLIEVRESRKRKKASGKLN
ncbi:MAG: hypothetical protein HYZ37_14255 [Candidatus Solibacter usitatus]|nr:hypothetical protein [Candidatus Solibacter usitatus]